MNPKTVYSLKWLLQKGGEWIWGRKRENSHSLYMSLLFESFIVIIYYPFSQKIKHHCGHRIFAIYLSK